MPAAIVVAAGCTLLTGCSRQFLSLFLDLPAPTPPVEAPAEPAAPAPVGTPLLLAPVDTARPPIEGTLDPDSAVALLPRDVAGNIDWMAALRNRVIKPRDFLPDSAPQAILPRGFTFAFDFFFEGPDPTFDAFFPHSAHTEWVDCRQCHGRVFKYQDNAATMAEILQGQSCGECHGKVAFPAVTGCERCHASLPMPPGRAQPDLIGTITMQRFEAAADDTVGGVASEAPAPPAPVTDSAAAEVASADTAAVAPDSTRQAGVAAASMGPATLGYSAAALPPSQFPHWVHRVRYTCKACHVGIFEAKAGANRVTMSDISEGKTCGVCHDGVTAFAAGFNECQRCHVDPASSTTGASGASPPVEPASGRSGRPDASP